MKESAQAQKDTGKSFYRFLLALLIFIPVAVTGDTRNIADGCIYPSASDTNRSHHP